GRPDSGMQGLRLAGPCRPGNECFGRTALPEFMGSAARLIVGNGHGLFRFRLDSVGSFILAQRPLLSHPGSYCSCGVPALISTVAACPAVTSTEMVPKILTTPAPRSASALTCAVALPRGPTAATVQLMPSAAGVRARRSLLSVIQAGTPSTVAG